LILRQANATTQMAAQRLARRERHKCPTAALRLLTRAPTIACEPRLAVNHLWGSDLYI
jgi:hypothetical protein